jgi:hypothetical protein
VTLALDEGDSRSIAALLHLGEELGIPNGRSGQKLRAAWVADLLKSSPTPGSRLLAVCVVDPMEDELVHRGERAKVAGFEKVFALFRRPDGLCRFVDASDVVRHPALGWIGVTPGLGGRIDACPSDEELRRELAKQPGCSRARFEDGAVVLE